MAAAAAFDFDACLSEMQVECIARMSPTTRLMFSLTSRRHWKDVNLPTSTPLRDTVLMQMTFHAIHVYEIAAQRSISLFLWVCELWHHVGLCEEPSDIVMGIFMKRMIGAAFEDALRRGCDGNEADTAFLDQILALCGRPKLDLAPLPGHDIHSVPLVIPGGNGDEEESHVVLNKPGHLDSLFITLGEIGVPLALMRRYFPPHFIREDTHYIGGIIKRDHATLLSQFTDHVPFSVSPHSIAKAAATYLSPACLRFIHTRASDGDGLFQYTRVKLLEKLNPLQSSLYGYAVDHSIHNSTATIIQTLEILTLLVGDEAMNRFRMSLFDMNASLFNFVSANPRFLYSVMKHGFPNGRPDERCATRLRYTADVNANTLSSHYADRLFRICLRLLLPPLDADSDETVWRRELAVWLVASLREHTHFFTFSWTEFVMHHGLLFLSTHKSLFLAMALMEEHGRHAVFPTASAIEFIGEARRNYIIRRHMTREDECAFRAGLEQHLKDSIRLTRTEKEERQIALDAWGDFEAK